MSPDGITLHLIAKELRETILPGRVERVFQPERQEIILVIRCSGQSRRLLLSAKAESAGMHLTIKEKKNPLTPPQFCIVLRKYLEGSRLTDIQQVGLDRIVRLTFNRIAENGKFQDVTLIVEIMGKHSNIILISPDCNRIIDGIKRYSHALSRYREVLPGRVYLSPPAQDKEDPQAISEEQFIRLMLSHPLTIPLDKVLFSSLEGLGYVLAREIIVRSGLAPELLLEYCGAHELQSLWRTIQDLIPSLYRGERVEPTVAFQERHPTACAPVSLTQYEELKIVKCNTVNEMLDLFYTANLEYNRLQQLQKHLAHVIKQEISRCSKKLSFQEQDEAEANSSLNLRLWGETIFANLHLIKPGAREASLPNIYEPDGHHINIKLVPSLTASQNAQRFFRKYNKARDSLKIIEKNKKKTAAEIRYLNSVEFALEEAASLSELLEVQAELVEAGYLRLHTKVKGTNKKKPRKEAPQIRNITSQNGFSILIGKNNKQNDYLTMRLAQPDDYWLHVKDSAGSHIIVKSAPGQEVPSSTLKEAAELAAYFSEARLSSNVPVDCTKRKNVSKPAGSRPGFVIYRNHKTFYVTPKAPQENGPDNYR
jgi:predicted ribosome quality control (RQC) complex YloA/Tae2 family protein